MYDHQVIIALISSLTALAVVVLQQLSNRKTSRKIEELKASLEQNRISQTEYLKAYLTSVVDGKRRHLDGVSALLETIQSFRDKVNEFLTDPSAFGADESAREIKTLAGSVAAAYQKIQITSERDRIPAHSAKNVCRDIAGTFRCAAFNSRDPQEVRAIFERIYQSEAQLHALQDEIRKVALLMATEYVTSLRDGRL